MRLEFHDRARREFTARYIADISKAIFAVAFASKLFVDLARIVRMLLPVIGILLFFGALIIHPKGEKR